MDCPSHEPSSCMVLPIDRFTFTHPDGSQSVYIFATPERLAAGELLEACRKAQGYFLAYAGVLALGPNPRDLKRAEQLRYFAGELESAIAKAQRGTP